MVTTNGRGISLPSRLNLIETSFQILRQDIQVRLSHHVKMLSRHFKYIDTLSCQRAPSKRVIRFGDLILRPQQRNPPRIRFSRITAKRSHVCPINFQVAFYLGDAKVRRDELQTPGLLQEVSESLVNAHRLERYGIYLDESVEEALHERNFV